MTSTPLTKEQARRSLVEHALNEICADSNFLKFQSRVYCVFAKYGLLMKAKEEDFLSGDEWSNLSQKDNLVKRVEQFLVEHIV